MNEEDLFEGLPLIDALDHGILMHREAHFGGQFAIMLDYYRRHGKGVNSDFSIGRIEELAILEKNLDQNLAALFLTAPEMEKIAAVRGAYKGLRSIYEIVRPKSKIPQLIADLILTEEEEAEEEIEVIVSYKGAAVPFLIDLLKSEDWHDPLFPGYGQAPELAVKCLGRIGDKRAIISIFETLGEGDFFEDEASLKALYQIGKSAKEFLLGVVKGKPYNDDNNRAAMALVAFKKDQEVGACALQLLKDPDVQNYPSLFSYLTIACEGLYDTPLAPELARLAEDPDLPKNTKQDLRLLLHSWKQF